VKRRGKRDIIVPGVLNVVLEVSSAEDVNTGGFKPRVAPVPFPKLAPISRIRIAVGRDVELVFKSKVAGRVAVVSQNSVKWH